MTAMRPTLYPTRWPAGITRLRQFLRSEDGAVTVDWVVLTAAVIGLGFAVVRPILGGATDVSGSVGAQLTSAGVTLNGIAAQN